MSVGRRAEKRIWHWVVVAGTQIVLEDGENGIGRDSASAVRLDSSGVSRVHARIAIAGLDVTIEDLGSKNGTRVGGRAVTAPTTLRDGDRIEIGSEVLIYRCSAAGLSTEAISLRVQLPEKLTIPR